MSRNRLSSRKLFFNASTHLLILAVFFFLQIGLIAVLSAFLQSLSSYLMALLYLIGLFVCLYVSARHDNSSTRGFWILLIAVFPAFGIIMYLMWGLPRHGRKSQSLAVHSQEAAEKALACFSKEDDHTKAISSITYKNNPSVRTISRYLTFQGFPVFSETRMKYFPSGEALFDDCIKEISRAKKTIFMAFFIFREGRLWDRFHDILMQKVASGVDVRILLDDAGTMFSLSPEMTATYREEGINIQFFNPTHRYLNNLYLNYRNHQKYIIIDSNIGYTGGINLSDEYANYTSPLGHWKDTGIRLTGRGVYGMTVTFINMWDQTVRKLSHSYTDYLPSIQVKGNGFCHVFDDGPFNNPKNPAEGMINRMIETAHESLLIATPYLAVSKYFINTLCRVSRSGVRVALLVPWKLDHWYVFEVTRSHFLPLMEAGVEVYRYTPGMQHAKMIVADDTHALVGSINLDNRSFYIQYEDGVWLYGNKVVSEVKADIEQAISQSCRVTIPEIQGAGFVRNSLGLVLRIFSPLM